MTRKRGLLVSYYISLSKSLEFRFHTRICSHLQVDILITAGPLITSFPNFSPAKATLATFLYNGWDCIFYIDTNRQLQFMRSADGGVSWSLQPQELANSWPLADEPNGPVAGATSINASDFSAYVYYISGKKIIQARIKDSDWLPASNIDGSAMTNSTSNADGTLNTSSPTSQSETTTVIKIGAAAGSSIFAVLILAVTLFCVHRKKKQFRSKTENRDESFVSKNESNEYGFTGKAELPGQPAHITELDHDPECLLLHQLQLRRLAELRAGVPVELAGKDVERGELDAGLCSCELDSDRKGREDVYELASPIVECEMLGCLGKGREGEMKEKCRMRSEVKELGLDDMKVVSESVMEVRSLKDGKNVSDDLSKGLQKSAKNEGEQANDRAKEG